MLLATLLFVSSLSTLTSGAPSVEGTKLLLSELNDILKEDDIKLNTNDDVLNNLEKYIKLKKEKLDQQHLEKQAKKSEFEKELLKLNNDDDSEDFLKKEIELLDQAVNEKRNSLTPKEKALAKLLDAEAQGDESATKELEDIVALQNFHKDKDIILRTEGANSYDAKREALNDTTCVDKFSINYCYKRASKGDCQVDHRMSTYCKRTCRFCCADDQKAVSTQQCQRFQKMDLCAEEKHKKRLRLLCPKSCGYCGGALNEYKCTGSEFGCCWDGGIAKNHVGTHNDGCKECKDRNTAVFCNRFRDRCTEKLRISGQLIRRICPYSCQICGAHKKCLDHPAMMDSCQQIKHDGNCQNNFKAMKYMCEKTCGLCDQNTVHCSKTKYGCCSDGKSISKGWFKEGCKECSDIVSSDYDCQFLKKHHACTQNEKSLRVLCPATCGFCLKGLK